MRWHTGLSLTTSYLYRVISTAYGREYAEFSRIISFAKILLFGPSSAMVVCPFAMTDGVARLAELFGPFTATGLEGDEVLKRLSSRDPDYAWTSGQWMTERPGGSDVSRTETIATKFVENNGNTEKLYLVNGFKWFSSATDSNVCALLAKVPGDNNKLSCFIGRVDTSNGQVKINRLKKKFGTLAVPTAELELRDMHAEMVGPQGRGVATIATVLNITRIHSAIGSLSFMRRALHIARQYSLVRTVFGKRLCHIQCHVKILAEQEVLARGLLFLNFYACKILGTQEYHGVGGHASSANKHEKQLLRVIPGVCKAITCKSAVTSISECMEALGGIGYLEHDVEYNIARLLRDAQVNPIWEGTTNTLADDFVRHVLKHGNSFIEAIDWFLKTTLVGIPPGGNKGSSNILGSLRQVIEKDWTDLKQIMSSSGSSSDIGTKNRTLLISNGREFILEFGRIVISALLISDALKGNSDSSLQPKIAIEIAVRWTLRDLKKSVLIKSSRWPEFDSIYSDYERESPEGKFVMFYSSYKASSLLLLSRLEPIKRLAIPRY